MRTEIVDLYQYFGEKRPEGAKGMLQCLLPQNPENIKADRLHPAVLIMPGGGYAYVSNREAEPVALRFAARGWCAFILDYSVAPHTYPTALREAAMAMAYIRSNAEKLLVAPDMVAAIGFSAGGHLCGCLGTLYDSHAVEDLGSAQLLRPDALGLCYPVALAWGRTHEGSFENITGGDEALRQQLSLDKLVRPDMPPVFLWHTRQDEAVPCRSSLLTAVALEEAGIPFAMSIYHRGPHGLSVADETVYPAGQVPAVSAGVPRWPEEMMAFFGEMGLTLADREG